MTNYLGEKLQTFSMFNKNLQSILEYVSIAPYARIILYKNKNSEWRIYRIVTKTISSRDDAGAIECGQRTDVCYQNIFNTALHGLYCHPQLRYHPAADYSLGNKTIEFRSANLRYHTRLIIGIAQNAGFLKDIHQVDIIYLSHRGSYFASN